MSNNLFPYACCQDVYFVTYIHTGCLSSARMYILENFKQKRTLQTDYTYFFNQKKKLKYNKESDVYAFMGILSYFVQRTDYKCHIRIFQLKITRHFLQ